MNFPTARVASTMNTTLGRLFGQTRGGAAEPPDQVVHSGTTTLLDELATVVLTGAQPHPAGSISTISELAWRYRDMDRKMPVMHRLSTMTRGMLNRMLYRPAVLAYWLELAAKSLMKGCSRRLALMLFKPPSDWLARADKFSDIRLLSKQIWFSRFGPF